MSDWTVEDSIAAAKGDPERAGRQLYELSNKRIALSNELLSLRGWRPMSDPVAKASGEILLHLNTGHDENGTISWMTIIGEWKGQWDGVIGLKDVRPSYWSPIPSPPEHLAVKKD